MRVRLFPAIALMTALLTIGLSVFGAVVRVTDSGLGCGNDWPLCNGSIIPPLDNLTAWIEWLHRLFAVVIGLFGIGMLVLAIRGYRKQNTTVLVVTVIAAILYASQAALGRWVVVHDLVPILVTLHLGMAMLLLAALLVAWGTAAFKPTPGPSRDSFTALAYITTALALIVILSGALVRGSGATLACTDWPLCNGELLPFNQGTLAVIHVFHRVIVLTLGVSLILLIMSARRNGRTGRRRLLPHFAATLYLAQAGIGAMFVVSGAEPIWGAAHVGFAAGTWALLVVISTFEILNSRESGQQTEWQRQSEPLRS